MALPDATLPLQKAIVAALKGAAAVTALVPAARVYDAPPPNASKPYIAMGPVQVLPERASEYDGADHFIQIDAWDGGPNTLTVKRIGAAILATLDNASLSLEDNNRLITIDVEQVNYLPDPDGITKHAALTFRARTEPTV